MSLGNQFMVLSGSVFGMEEQDVGPFNLISFVGPLIFLDDQATPAIQLKLSTWTVVDGDALGKPELEGTQWNSVILGQAK